MLVCADIFTKFFAKKSKAIWELDHKNVGIHAAKVLKGKDGGISFQGEWLKMLGSAGPGYTSLLDIDKRADPKKQEKS